MRVSGFVAVVWLAGCATVEPGHVGLMFKPTAGGLERQPLKPGLYYLAPFNHIEDFDVTYSTRSEEIDTASSEGLGLTMHVAVIYRPILAELYDLDADTGLNYYDEVIGPEFRSAARGVFARHSYLELLRHNEDIENEIETDLRRRTSGKHVEISSVTMESVQYAPEIGKAVQDKLVAEQDALRQKTLLENEAARRRLEIQSQAEQEKIKADAALRQKQQEMELEKEQVSLDRVREEAEAEKVVTAARAQAEETKLKAEADAARLTLLANAHAAENRALTPLAVMLHGYDALQAMASGGAHVYLGDWSHVPSFLFPANLQLRTALTEAAPASKPAAAE
jgi:regulator of protease activity HflC (stomatin/prohibitin superfamily)